MDSYMGHGRALVAIDAKTGDERWRFKTDEPVFPGPTVSNGTIYFGGPGVLRACGNRPLSGTPRNVIQLRVKETFMRSPKLQLLLLLLITAGGSLGAEATNYLGGTGSQAVRSFDEVVRTAVSLSFMELRRTPPCRTTSGQEIFMPVKPIEVDAMLNVAKVTARAHCSRPRIP
jgi:hypothetical protein